MLNQLMVSERRILEATCKRVNSFVCVGYENVNNMRHIVALKPQPVVAQGL